MKKAYTIGVDLGGTKIEAGLVDQDGKAGRTVRLPTDVKGGVKAIEEQIVGAVEQLIHEVKEPIAAVGVGVPGQIAEEGVVYFAPNLSWHQVPLQRDLEAQLHLPVKIVNDVRAIAWGEWMFGAGQKTSDMVCVFVGTGIGSGVVSGGRMLEGSSGTFGEAGHMSIDVNGPLCTCGNRGCWESIAGGWGIGQKGRELVEKNPQAGSAILKLAEGKLSSISAKTIVEAYKNKDPLAMEIIEEAKLALIAGCTNLVNLYNPRKLVLGGGVLDGMPELIDEIAKGVGRKALKAASQFLEIVPAKLGKEAGVIGAAAVAMQKFPK